MVYGVALNTPLPPAGLVVDYDLSRLDGVDPARRRCCELADLNGRFERILVNVLPSTPRIQYRLDFYHAARLLQPGGSLRVVVHLRKAARMVERELLQVFADVQREPGQAVFTCSGRRPGEPPNQVRIYRYRDPVSGRELELQTRPGLFAYRGLDPGTALLLKAADELNGCACLDLGCGYGAVGLVASARGAQVTLVDIDARAVALARVNAERNGLEADVRLQDGTGDLAPGSFHRVLSNPPTHTGSAVLRRLFAESLEVLEAQGKALFVVREHLNYEKWLQEMGTLATPLTGSGYKILKLSRIGR